MIPMFVQTRSSCSPSQLWLPPLSPSSSPRGGRERGRSSSPRINAGCRFYAARLTHRPLACANDRMVKRKPTADVRESFPSTSSSLRTQSSRTVHNTVNMSPLQMKTASFRCSTALPIPPSPRYLPGDLVTADAQRSTSPTNLSGVQSEVCSSDKKPGLSRTGPPAWVVSVKYNILSPNSMKNLSSTCNRNSSFEELIT